MICKGCLISYMIIVSLCERKCVLMSKHHSLSSNNFVINWTKSNEMSLKGRSCVVWYRVAGCLVRLLQSCSGKYCISYGPLVTQVVCCCVANRLQRRVLMWGYRSNKITYGEDKYPQIYLPLPQLKRSRTQTEGKIDPVWWGRQMKAWMYSDTHYIKDGAGYKWVVSSTSWPLYLRGGRVFYRDLLDVLERTEISCPYGDSKHDFVCPVRGALTVNTALPTLLIQPIFT
jgi:hypothetical protein